MAGIFISCFPIFPPNMSGISVTKTRDGHNKARHPTGILSRTHCTTYINEMKIEMGFRTILTLCVISHTCTLCNI